MFGVLVAGIAEVRDLDPQQLNSTALNDAIVELEHLTAQLEAAVAAKIAAWTERRCWQAAHAKSPAAWLAWKTHQPPRNLRRQVNLANTLAVMPVAARAWADGD